MIVRIRKINSKQEKDIMGNSYFLVILGILLAKGLGFYRDMVFAGVNVLRALDVLRVVIGAYC